MLALFWLVALLSFVGLLVGLVCFLVWFVCLFNDSCLGAALVDFRGYMFIIYSEISQIVVQMSQQFNQGAVLPLRSFKCPKEH